MSLKPEMLEDILAEYEVMQKDFHRCLDGIITKKQEQQSESKKKNEIESRMAEEIKINKELQETYDKLCKKEAYLKQANTDQHLRLTVCENDQKRLDLAKALCEFGKEATGIRFDFSAPPNKARGYIKNESCKMLVTFEEDEIACPEALWEKMYDMVDPRWAAAYDENIPPSNS